jgi:hypothetical protein
MPSATFQVDQPIPSDQCWFRFIVRDDYINKDGTLSHQALKGSGAFSAAPPGKPWDHELSGAIVSLAGNIPNIQIGGEKMASDAQARFVASHGKASSKICFAGVICASGRELETVIQGTPVAAVYTPDLPTDPAHSDFVTYGTTTGASIDPIRDWLLFNLRIIRLGQLAQLASCGS